VQENSLFSFTNPDCVNDIEITKIAIIRGDGNIIYEGPYLQVQFDGTRAIIDRPMKPHEVWGLVLFQYMYLGGDPTAPSSWVDVFTAIKQPRQAYTVEIFWRPAGKGSTLPLMGQWYTTTDKLDPSSPDIIITHQLRTESQMVNMTEGK